MNLWELKDVKKNKKFREKYVVVPLNPIMPRDFDAKRRKELRKWEQETKNMQSKLNKKDIGKEPGE